MKLAVLTLDEGGGALAATLDRRLPFFVGGACEVAELRSGRDGELSTLAARAFAECQGLVFVMASGIAMRMVAPLLVSKLTDPAVVVLDDEARWAISLLSGHEGGANRLAYQVAAATGAEPVVTTGSETRRKVVLGIGCRKGISSQVLRSAVEAILAEAGLAPTDLRCAVSARAKEGEAGLVSALREMDIPLLFLGAERINNYDGPFEPSPAASRNLGLKAVAEPCALLGARRGSLLISKRRISGVTVALAREDS